MTILVTLDMSTPLARAYRCIGPAGDASRDNGPDNRVALSSDAAHL